MKKVVTQTYGFSDIGPIRPNNEDVWISMPEHSFFALADGMGGHNAGEVAAKEAISNLSLSISKNLTPDLKKCDSLKEMILLIQKAIKQANKWVYELGKSKKSYKGMGTTLCCLYLFQDSVIYGHIGDSRIYRYRNQNLLQLTEDHSLVSGWSSEEEVPENYKNIITRAIGTHPHVEPEIATMSILPGDLFFMCSDGLSDFVNQDEIKKIIESKKVLKEATKELIQAAKNNGSHDNITILMIKTKSFEDGKTHLSRS